MNNSDSSADVDQPVPNGKRILAVDDEPNILRFIKENLQRRGYEVETASKGVEALAKIKAGKPDALIADAMMPEMDGVVLISKIRSDAALADLPTLFMVLRPDHGSLTAETIDYYLGIGANQVLVKPFTPQDLRAKIHKLLFSSPSKDQ